MCGTAEATKDHLNEYSLLEQPAWLPGTIPGISDKRDRSTAESGPVLSQCGMSAMAVLCYAHGTRVLAVGAQRRHRHRAAYRRRTMSSMADDTVEPSVGLPVT